MRILFIRHGETEGNQKKRYIGSSDEELCLQGREKLLQCLYESVELVVCSPMRRCRQTADVIYPDMVPVVYENLRECDFGEFEGKNYKELEGNANYQRWVDSGGKLPFPGGEDAEDFKERSVQAFLEAVQEHAERRSIAFVVHGGTIMAVLERLAVPAKSFYDYNVKNGRGYVTEWDRDAKALHILDKI